MKIVPIILVETHSKNVSKIDWNFHLCAGPKCNIFHLFHRFPNFLRKFKAKVHNLSRPSCASFRLQFTFSIKMGNLKSSLSAIAAENCAQTFSFSFGNGRQFPATTVGPLAIQPRVNTNLLTAAFNDDLTGKL